MSGQYDFPVLEQDVEGPGDDLPTYDTLASQSGPNSRSDLLQVHSSVMSEFEHGSIDLGGGEDGSKRGEFMAL
jgi:hypothetical protein